MKYSNPLIIKPTIHKKPTARISTSNYLARPTPGVPNSGRRFKSRAHSSATLAQEDTLHDTSTAQTDPAEPHPDAPDHAVQAAPGSTGTTHCIHVPGPQGTVKQGASKQERHHAAEANWNSFHFHARTEFFSTYAQRAQMMREQQQSLVQQLTDAVNGAACPCCGSGADSCVVARSVPVTVVDVQSVSTLQVPVFRCNR